MYICIIAAKSFQIFLKHTKVLLYTKQRKEERMKERKKERKKKKDAFVILSFLHLISYVVGCGGFFFLGVGVFGWGFFFGGRGVHV